MRNPIKSFLRSFSSKPPRAKIYSYMYDPAQLCFLCECLWETKMVEGKVVEVGCAMGRTTVFLGLYMMSRAIEKPYVAIDTFSGFVKEDIEFEALNRRKNPNLYRNAFRNNSKSAFDQLIAYHEIPQVTSVQADVNEYDLRSLGPLSFCLLDVDLYRPIRNSLPQLYESLEPGGIIVVDDCDSSNNKWDGADQAYKEFMAEMDKPAEIVFKKLGLVRK